MEVSISDDNLIVKWNDYFFKYKLKWIVFGSKDSIDYDVAIYVEYDLINKCIGHYNEICYQLDSLLIPILCTDKPINSCLAFWNDQVEWCQKGSVDESNNSYIMTYGNHVQRFDGPTKLMKRNISRKILSSTRIIICMLIHAKYHGDIRDLLCSYLKLPEVLLISDLKLFICNMIGRFPEVPLNQTEKNNVFGLGKLKVLRSKRNALLKSLILAIESRNFKSIDDIIEKVFILHDEANIISEQITYFI